MTLDRDFKVVIFFDIEYLTNDMRYSHDYYRTSIGSDMRSIEWWQFQWPWRTLTLFSLIFSFIYLHLYIFICLLTSDEPIWYKLPSPHCRTYEFWQVKHTRNSAIGDKPRDPFIGQSRSSNMVPFDMFISVCFRNYVRKTRRFSDIRLQNAVTLKTGLRVQEGNWKKMPFNREPMPSCWWSIVTMALSRVDSEIFNVEKYRDLEIPVKSQLW